MLPRGAGGDSVTMLPRGAPRRALVAKKGGRGGDGGPACCASFRARLCNTALTSRERAYPHGCARATASPIEPGARARTKAGGVEMVRELPLVRVHGARSLMERSPKVCSTSAVAGPFRRTLRMAAMTCTRLPGARGLTRRTLVPRCCLPFLVGPPALAHFFVLRTKLADSFRYSVFQVSHLRDGTQKLIRDLPRLKAPL